MIVVSPSARNKGYASHINLFFGSVVSFALSGFASIAVTANAFAESSHPLRLGLVLLSLILLHTIFVPKLWVSRELQIYLVFMGYMCVSLLWTQDVSLATDTLALASNCVLILVLYGALVVYHNRRAVFTGMLVGFLIAAVYFTLTQRFPFTFPDGFSYNSIAGMYLFGLFATIMFGWFTRRAVIPIAIGLVLLLLVAATTSIKTNLGIALGAGLAGLLYFRVFIRALRKTMLLMIVLGALIVMALNSNAELVERIDVGMSRVNLGIKALLAREDITAGTTLSDRKTWQDEGLRGWVRNPILGNGVEEFRADFGVTSHSTPVDLLYNSGLIGFGLFYGILISIGWRLHRAPDSANSGLRAFLSGLLVCYAFISLSAPMYYETLLAVFVAISAAVLEVTPLRKPSGQTG